MPVSCAFVLGLSLGACSAGLNGSGGADEMTEMSPAEPFAASGLLGGPVLPDCAQYRWTNHSTTPIGYARDTSVGWVTASGPSEGIVGHQQTVLIDLCLVPSSVATLPVGEHRATVSYRLIGTERVLDSIEVIVQIDPPSQGYSMNLRPTSGLSSAGPAGGPFAPGSKSYTWANTGNAAIDYSRVVSAPWVTVSLPATGSVAAGATRSFDVGVDQAAAAVLAPGSYAAQVRLLDADSAQPVDLIDVQLAIGSDRVILDPPDGFTASGPAGGPFSPSARNYTLRNLGTDPLDYRRTTSASWLDVTGPLTGTIPIDGVVSFTVSLNPTEVNSFGVGTYNAHVAFWNTLTDDEVAGVDVVLLVRSQAGDLSVPPWSTPQQRPGSRTVHVSTDGSDSTGDGSAASPYATIDRGWQDIRAGSSDWLLLERGSTWTDELSIDKGGVDVDHPLVIGSYGSGPRPIIQHNSGPLGSRYNRTQNFVTVIGLRLQPVGWAETDPMISGSAFSIKGGTCDDWVIEDCFFGGFNNGITLDGKSQPSRRQRTVVRGCIFVGNHVHIYADDTDDALFEYNYFHRPVRRPTGDGGYPHSIYHQAGNQQLTIRRNCFGFGDDTRSSGVEFRGNHTVLADNYMFRTDAGVWMGSHSPTAPPPAGGLQMQIERNVFDAMIGQSDDVHLAHVAGGTYRSNLHIHRSGGFGACVGLARGAQNSDPPMTGVHNLDIDNLVVYSTATESRVIQVLSSANSDITVRCCRIMAGNIFLYAASGRGSLFTSYDNEWNSTQTRLSYLADAPSPGPSYVASEYAAFLTEMADPPAGELASVLRMPTFADPTRSGATYVDMVEGVSGSGYQDLADRLLAQTKDSWNADYSAPRINAWLQEGFDVRDRSN